MSRTTAPEFAAVFPRAGDDPYHRIQVLAEKRAKRNGHQDPEQAGRAAMALRKMLVASGENEPSTEHILSTVAGAYKPA